MIAFSEEEIKNYNLKIPNAEEIEEILKAMEKVDPTCSGAVSGSQISPVPGCPCTYSNYNTTSPETCSGLLSPWPQSPKHAIFWKYPN